MRFSRFSEVFKIFDFPWLSSFWSQISGLLLTLTIRIETFLNRSKQNPFCQTCFVFIRNLGKEHGSRGRFPGFLRFFCHFDLTWQAAFKEANDTSQKSWISIRILFGNSFWLVPMKGLVLTDIKMLRKLWRNHHAVCFRSKFDTLVK